MTDKCDDSSPKRKRGLSTDLWADNQLSLNSDLPRSYGPVDKEAKFSDFRCSVTPSGNKVARIRRSDIDSSPVIPVMSSSTFSTSCNTTHESQTSANACFTSGSPRYDRSADSSVQSPFVAASYFKVPKKRISNGFSDFFLSERLVTTASPSLMERCDEDDVIANSDEGKRSSSSFGQNHSSSSPPSFCSVEFIQTSAESSADSSLSSIAAERSHVAQSRHDDDDDDDYKHVDRIDVIAASCRETDDGNEADKSLLDVSSDADHEFSDYRSIMNANDDDDDDIGITQNHLHDFSKLQLRESSSIIGPLFSDDDIKRPPSSYNLHIITSTSPAAVGQVSRPPPIDITSPSTASSSSSPRHVRSDSLCATRIIVSSLTSPRLVTLEDFDILKSAGFGNFSRVLLCRSKTNSRLFAIKHSESFKTKKERDYLAREAKAYEDFKGLCPYIVGFHCAWQHSCFVYLQLEFCSRGSLDNLMKYCKENRTDEVIFHDCTLFKIIHDVSLGLACIHELGYVHMDVKASNVMISDDGICKIGDFGLVVRDGDNSSVEGDVRYLAPELLLEGTLRRSSIDVFCFGSMLYELATGSDLPHSGERWRKIRVGNATPLPTFRDAELTGLIGEMMHVSPQARPSCRSISSKPVIQSAGGIDDAIMSGPVLMPDIVLGRSASCSSYDLVTPTISGNQFDFNK